MKTINHLECLSSVGQNNKTITEYLTNNAIRVTTNLSVLISAALTIQGKLFPCLLAAGGVVFIISLVALIFLKRTFKKHNQDKPNQSKSILIATMLIGVTAAGLALASAVATTQTANALKFAASSPAIGNGKIRLSPGVTLQALQWLVVAFSTLFQLALVSMFTVEGNVSAAGTEPQGSSSHGGPVSMSDNFSGGYAPNTRNSVDSELNS